MALTKDDLQAIQQAVVDTTTPMFELVFERFDRLELRMDRVEGRLDRVEGRLDRIEKVQDEHTNRLRRVEEKIDTVNGRLKAVENDIKDLYQMVAELQKQQMPSRFSQRSAEQKVIKAYQDVLAVAKELNITLPAK